MRIVEEKRGNSPKIGIISILGVEIELAAGLIGLPLFCILRVPSSELVIYRVEPDGEGIVVKRTNFPVRNVDYR